MVAWPVRGEIGSLACSKRSVALEEQPEPLLTMAQGDWLGPDLPSLLASNHPPRGTASLYASRALRWLPLALSPHLDHHAFCAPELSQRDVCLLLMLNSPASC